MRHSLKFAGNWDKVNPLRNSKGPDRSLHYFDTLSFKTSLQLSSQEGSDYTLGHAFRKGEEMAGSSGCLCEHQVPPQNYIIPLIISRPGLLQSPMPGRVPVRPATSFRYQQRRSGTEHEELHPQHTGVTGRMPLAFTRLGFHPKQRSLVEKLQAKYAHGIHNIHL